MSQYSNDDIMYSEKYGSILSETDRKIIEDKTTRKIIDIPKDLLDEFKEMKYSYIKNNVYNFNESMIIRVGTRLVIEGINSIVLSLVNDEESLVKSLWMLFSIESSNDTERHNLNDIYSHNIDTIISQNSKMDYSTFCLRKTVILPFSLFSQVKNAKIEIEKETGSYWVKENTFYRIGMRLMLEILKRVDISIVKSEQDLYEKAKSVIDIS